MPPEADVPTLSGVESTREETRKWLAYIALGGFFGLLSFVIVVGWLVRGWPTDQVMDVVTTTSGVLSGVVGAIVGFYFRSVGDSSEGNSG